MTTDTSEQTGENGTIATRVKQIISNGPSALTEAEMAMLREDLRVATEKIRSEYHERTGRQLANPGPRDVLTVWLDAVAGKQNYVKNPADWFIVHTVIPEILSPPMQLPQLRERWAAHSLSLRNNNR